MDAAPPAITQEKRLAITRFSHADAFGFHFKVRRNATPKIAIRTRLSVQTTPNPWAAEAKGDEIKPVERSSLVNPTRKSATWSKDVRLSPFHKPDIGVLATELVDS